MQCIEEDNHGKEDSTNVSSAIDTEQLVNMLSEKINPTSLKNVLPEVVFSMNLLQRAKPSSSISSTCKIMCKKTTSQSVCDFVSR